MPVTAIRYAICALAVALLAGGCGGEKLAAPKPVYVLAASSTADATQQSLAAMENVRVSTGGSNQLAQQILAGAPADIFLCANPEWAELLDKQGRVAGREDFLSNTLVIVAPLDNPAGISKPEDLTGEGVRYVALAGEKVPAGIYAKQALVADRLYQTLVDSKRIIRGQDVRLALSYVETGDADAGIVYATDALASKKVKVVYRYSGEHETIIYPLLLLNPADGSEVDQDVYRAYEMMRTNKAIYTMAGFVPAPALRYGAVVPAGATAPAAPASPASDTEAAP